MKNLWKVWRDVLRWQVWDDLLVTAVLVCAPLFACFLAWQCFAAPLPIQANPAVKTIGEVPVSVRVNTVPRYGNRRWLGPRD